MRSRRSARMRSKSTSISRSEIAAVGSSMTTRRAFCAAPSRLDKLLMADPEPRRPVYRAGVGPAAGCRASRSALSQRARLLVTDEPTAAISDREIEVLFDRIRALRRDRMGIVYISHRLREAFEIGDRITVLRDGQQVADVRPSVNHHRRSVRMMVGREVSTTYRKTFCTHPGETILETRKLTAANGIAGADIEVRAGEIVGLAGLVGAGRTELARAIFGADPIVSGEVRLLGKPSLEGRSRRSERGIGLVPENRKTQGLALVHSVQDNMLLAGLRRHFPARPGPAWHKPFVWRLDSSSSCARPRHHPIAPRSF